MRLQGNTQTVRGKGARPPPEARTTGRSLCRARSERERVRAQGTSFSSSELLSRPRSQCSFMILTQKKGCINKNIIYFC